MQEFQQPEAERVMSVQQIMANEELIAVYQAFPHFVKATELAQQADIYHEQALELTNKINELHICPILRLKRWKLKFLIESTLSEARGQHLLGNDLLPPDRPFV